MTHVSYGFLENYS